MNIMRYLWDSRLPEPLRGIIRLAVLLFLVSPVFGTTRYVAQTAGTFSGGTACNGQTAITPATFDGLTLAAGDIIYLCGTITAPAGASDFLTIAQNGSSGNPITLIYDSGATLTAPYWSGPIIYVTGNYVTVNGGTNGVSQATANGTGLANQQTGSTCITTSNASNFLVENLTCSNLYVRTCTAPTSSCTDENQYGTGFQFNGGSNVIASNNTLHDMHWAIVYSGAPSGSTSNFQANGNTIYDVDHGIVPSIGNGTSSTISGIFLFANHIYNFQNWDDAADDNHHDGIHAFAFTGGTMSNLNFYGNLIDGNWGTNTNAGIYIEFQDQGGTSSGCSVFTNILNPSNGNAASGGIADYSTTGCYSVYNTILTQGIIEGYATSGGASFLGNVITGQGNTIPEILGDGHGGKITASDYNAFAILPTNGNGFVTAGGGCCIDFSQWQTAGFDTHAVQSSPNGQGAASYLNLSSGYVPNSGSPLIAAGENLNGVCNGQPNPGLGALCYDYSGNARPTSGNWDIGAFNYSAGTSYTLTTTLVGTGSVSSSPSGISCPSTCSASYSSGTVVTLTATAGTGYTFTGWTGAGCSGTGTCAVTMSAAESVTATFAANTAAPGSVVISGGVVVNGGTVSK